MNGQHLKLPIPFVITWMRSYRQRSYSELIQFVQDRPGHDFRYAIDATKIASKLGWKAEETFETGIKKTIEWYIKKIYRIGCCTMNNYLVDFSVIGDKRGSLVSLEALKNIPFENKKNLLHFQCQQ